MAGVTVAVAVKVEVVVLEVTTSALFMKVAVVNTMEVDGVLTIVILLFSNSQHEAHVTLLMQLLPSLSMILFAKCDKHVF